jgi:hypothetical protein
MSHTVEISNEGTIRLPSDVLERMKPHTRFVVEVHNHIVVLRPEDEQQPFWATATPEEKTERFRRWIEEIRKQENSPALPDEALRRESMYD